MPYRTFEGQNCSIARALAVVGERWSLLVVREVLLGRGRFREIQRQTGVAPNILSDRLDTLVEQGVLERRPSRDDPSTPEYQATPKGRDLVPVLAALTHWGDAYESPNGPPRVFFHSDCGHDIDFLVHCPHCDVEVSPPDVRARPGPGATPEQRADGELPAASHARAGT
jgi:DNA-binding HxlR family transcriptional regulator